MEKMDTKKWIVVLIHAAIGWTLCGAVMGIGPTVMAMETMLIVHAILAPVFFGIISFVYFTKFNYTTPLQTAVIFTAFVILTDFFVVALLIEKSLEMFTSVLGTWLPFTLIFASTYLVGRLPPNASRSPLSSQV
jgi:hypothetical protein